MKRLKIIAISMLFFLALLNIKKGSSHTDMNLSLSQLLAITTANAEDCIGSTDGFCKNDPIQNDGVCVERMSDICCRETEEYNHDCYAVGL
ncbi:MAG TPA: hypothetical protein VEP89_03510 [Draconibacterium sp.]|nr:hypothetical protein [Draconibacterium sp.]